MMTRLWPDGHPIAVSDEDGLPQSFTWQGRTHRVAAVAKRWRLDLGWWGARVWHAYYKVSTDTGLLVVIYRDLVTGKWYLQRLYD